MARRKGNQRYGVILLPYSVSYQRMLEAAKHAEQLGFDSLWVSDHLQRGPIPTFECWTMISALSAMTDKIRIGSLATCNSFRNPALLAKMVSSASQISNGRTDVAIGAGYDEAEHLAGGFSFPPFGERVARLSESLEILVSLWTKKSSSFVGEYYNLKDAVCEPKPIGLPRLWVAGRNKSVLEVASKQAYGVNILPYSGVLENRKISSFEELKQISELIDSYKSLHKSIYCGDGGLVIGKDPSDYERRVRKLAEIQQAPLSEIENKLKNLSIIHGTLEDCRESIERIVSLGFEELMMIFPGWQQGNYESMDVFAEEFIG